MTLQTLKTEGEGPGADTHKAKKKNAKTGPATSRCEGEKWSSVHSKVAGGMYETIRLSGVEQHFKWKQCIVVASEVAGAQGATTQRRALPTPRWA